MRTNINAKQLAVLYNMGYSTYMKYLAPHREQLKELATKRMCREKNREVVCRFYNSRQLAYIIQEIMKDTPEGYAFDGRLLMKV